MNKKGFFFTIGLTLFAFIILTLSVVTSKHLGTYDDRFIEMSAFNRLSDLDTSIQKSLRETFDLTTEISLGINGNQAIITQTLPFNLTSLNQSLKQLKSFVEANDKHLNISIDKVQKKGSIWLQPNQIEYFQNTTERSLNIEPNSQTIEAYKIIIETDETTNITSCSTSTTTGSTYLNVEVRDTNGTACNIDTTVDLSASNSLIAGDIEFTTLSNKGINLKTSSTVITITTTINVTKINNDTLGIYFPENSINIDLGKLGLSKTGTAKLT